MTTLQQLLTERETAYHIRQDVDEVLNFVEANPFLLPLIHEAPSQIYQIFGPDVALELEFDPGEKGPDEDELFIIIRLKDMSPETANAKLNELFARWWREGDRSGRGKMNIGVGWQE